MNYSIKVCCPTSEKIDTIISILQKKLNDYGSVPSSVTVNDADILLDIDASIGLDGYRMENSGTSLKLIGNNELGLLYAVGKLLHTSHYSRNSFELSTWRGESIPDCSMRGIYMANNFINWNHACPLDEMKNYISELTLWGMNTLAYCFPHYATLPDKVAKDYLNRNREIIDYATSLGIRVGLLYAPNFGFGKIPKDIQASPFPDTEPARRGNGKNPTSFVCPSNPDGRKFILDRLGADLDCYKGLDIGFLVSFPYDAGGCGCDDCWPWGAKGFVELSHDLANLGKERFKDCKFVLTTWCYDVREESDGEYEGLDNALKAGNDWCDAIMTDAHGAFPEYPLKHGVPGGLPMINFAEISMWGRFPWGGSAANPFPKRLVEIWNQAKHLLDGGLPYSEGRFEDINKVSCISLFWNKDISAKEIIREYVNFEYGSDAVESLMTVIDILEDTYPTDNLCLKQAKKALELIEEAEAKLPERTLNSWRWRILKLRAIIDVEKMSSTEFVTETLNNAYEELTTLYCAQKAGGPVAPRSKSFFDREDIEIKGPQYAEHIGEQASDPNKI